MQDYILREGTLNDDVLIVSDKNKVFKGNYIAIVKQYSFLNHWCNSEKITRFRSQKKLETFLNKHYTDLDLLDFTNTSIE